MANTAIANNFMTAPRCLVLVFFSLSCNQDHKSGCCVMSPRRSTLTTCCQPPIDRVGRNATIPIHRLTGVQIQSLGVLELR